MKNTARAVLIAALLSLIAGPALAQNVPANSVQGRLGIPTAGGKVESIPFLQLAGALAPNFITTALKGASFEATTTGGFKLGGSTFANQVTTLGVAVNWLYAPDGGFWLYGDNTATIVFGDTIYNKAKNATVLSSLSSTVYQVNSNQVAIGAAPLAGILNIKGSNSDSNVIYAAGQGSALSLTNLPVTVTLQDYSTGHSALIDFRAVDSAGTVIGQAAGLNPGLIWWDANHVQSDWDFNGYRNGTFETMLQLVSGCATASNNNGNGPACASDQDPQLAPGTNAIYNLGGIYGTGQRWKTIYGTNLDVTGNLVLGGSSSGSTTVHASATASGTLTLPAATDTLVGKATTDIFTNKSISGATNTLSSIALSSHATQAAYTFVGNNTGSAAAPTAVDIAALTTKATPAATDYVMLSDQAASGAWKKSTVTTLLSAGAVTSLNSKTGGISFSITLQTFCPSGCTTTIAGGSTGTYTPTTGTVYARLGCYGAGGGGGGAANSATGISGGGGGGSGGFSETVASAATIGASQTVSIGTAGTAGTAGANNGGNGGDSSVGSITIGKGATGGSGAPNITSGAGGAGGVSGTGTMKGTGGTGIAGYGASVITALYPAGNGASTAIGGGGVASNGAGGAATGFGAGGAGGVSYNNSGNLAGGAGSAGYCYAYDHVVN